MGAFDPGTQRRIRNVSSARILPAAEVLPPTAPPEACPVLRTS